MHEKPIVIYTDHIINRNICYNFAKGSKSLMCHVNKYNDYTKTIATYGFLRGTGDLIRKVKNFYYIDHGYLKQSNRLFEKNKTKIINLDGYFRIVYNDYWHNGFGNKPSDRFEELNLNLKKLNKNGNYIIISEPSLDDINYFSLENWLKQTTNLLKKYTDRKIIVHNRTSNVPLSELLKNAWAFVSSHSTAGFKAMIEGVPAYFTNSTLENIGSIKKIEEHEINYSALYNLAYEQWNLEEIKSGKAWDYLSKNY